MIGADQRQDRPRQERAGWLPGTGQRTREGQSQREIANQLYPIIENLLDELDRWFSV